MLRLLIEDVTLTRGDDIRVEVRWEGGATTELHVPIPPLCPGRRIEGLSAVLLPFTAGDTPDEALADWRDQVHEAFQVLYRKRPFEMTADERRRWEALESLVDLMEIHGQEWLLYRTFPIDVVFLRGTTADPDGNVSMEREALTLDNLAMAMAAKNSTCLASPRCRATG
jgi:hypothetical protein